MTAPTHAAFAVAVGMLCGVDPVHLGLLAGGALLPDIDHPQSAIGRIFFPLSIPLNKRFGHRKAVHGFAIWGALALLGIWWRPAYFIGMGALSHVFIDCWTISGVEAFRPFSEKVCVLFSRHYRIVTGSRTELIILLVFAVLAWSGNRITSSGGIRSVIASVVGSYQIAVEEFVSAGTKICHMEGKLRYPDGTIKEGRWLVIGTEGKSAIAIQDGEKLLHIPHDAQFLRARLDISKTDWKTMQLSGMAETEVPVFMFSKQSGKWIAAPAGSLVSGYVIGDEIKLKAAAF